MKTDRFEILLILSILSKSSGLSHRVLVRPALASAAAMVLRAGFIPPPPLGETCAAS